MKTARKVDRAIEIKTIQKELKEELQNITGSLQDATNYTQKGKTRILDGTNGNQVILKHYVRKYLKSGVSVKSLFRKIAIEDFYKIVNPNAAKLAKFFGKKYISEDVQEYHTLVVKK